LNVNSNVEKQTINTIIDHIEKKCLIIVNNWSEDGDNEIKFIEGSLPSKRLRYEKMVKSAPLNQYIYRIFEEDG